MSLTEPLAPGQQMLLQRLMASHVMAHEEAHEVFARTNDDTRCRSLEEYFRFINEQLKAGFGLEIATVVLNGVKHHAVVNPHADDDIAKSSFEKALPPSEREYTRKVLETLVQASGDEGDDESPGNTRMVLINLRTKLDPKYKLSVQETENCLDRLLAEHWISYVADKENRRKSLKTEYAIGPRSYLELRHMLQDFGLDEFPQCIYHRST
jgi:hypothetical protein